MLLANDYKTKIHNNNLLSVDPKPDRAENSQSNATNEALLMSASICGHNDSKFSAVTSHMVVTICLEKQTTIIQS